MAAGNGEEGPFGCVWVGRRCSTGGRSLAGPHTCAADGRPDRGQGDATEESENCPSQSGSPPLKDVAAAHFPCLEGASQQTPLKVYKVPALLVTHFKADTAWKISHGFHQGKPLILLFQLRECIAWRQRSPLGPLVDFSCQCNPTIMSNLI